MDKTEPTIKVLHLIDSGGLYGAEKMLLTLCSEQIKQGLQPTILSCGTVSEKPKAVELEAERLGISCKAWRMKAGLNVKGMRKIWVWVHEHGFTHLHSHGYKFNILLALTKECADEVKLVTTVHGYVAPKLFSKMWLYEVLDRVALRNFERIILVSNAMEKIPAIQKQAAKTQVVFNGLPVRYEQEKLRGQEEILRDKFDLLGLAVGRLSPEKGFDILVLALAALYKKRPDLKEKFGIIVYGEGGQRLELERLIYDNGLSENVFLAGYVNNAGSLMSHFDVLLMPSLTEGLPITLLEAVRSKLPVVASNVGAISTVLGESYRYLVEPGKIESLEDVLALFLLQQDEIKQQTNAPWEVFKKTFSSKVMAAAYLDQYTSTLKDKGSV